jgi:hypothetical protein
MSKDKEFSDLIDGISNKGQNNLRPADQVKKPTTAPVSGDEIERREREALAKRHLASSIRSAIHRVPAGAISTTDTQALRKAIIESAGPMPNDAAARQLRATVDAALAAKRTLGNLDADRAVFAGIEGIAKELSEHRTWAPPATDTSGVEMDPDKLAAGIAAIN